VNFHHFPHQTIRSTAYGSDLLQDGNAGIAVFQRALQCVNLPTDATNPSEDTFLSSGECGIATPFIL
jgi:hypothetical protein